MQSNVVPTSTYTENTTAKDIVVGDKRIIKTKNFSVSYEEKIKNQLTENQATFLRYRITLLQKESLITRDAELAFKVFEAVLLDQSEFSLSKNSFLKKLNTLISQMKKGNYDLFARLAVQQTHQDKKISNGLKINTV